MARDKLGGGSSNSRVFGTRRPQPSLPRVYLGRAFKCDPDFSLRERGIVSGNGRFTFTNQPSCHAKCLQRALRRGHETDPIQLNFFRFGAGVGRIRVPGDFRDNKF